MDRDLDKYEEFHWSGSCRKTSMPQPALVVVQVTTDLEPLDKEMDNPRTDLCVPMAEDKNRECRSHSALIYTDTSREDRP